MNPMSNVRAGGIASPPELKRVLGPFELVMMGVGSAVGAGVFVLTGMVSARYAGPAVTLSYLIAAIACLLAALCYAELAGMLPRAGSAYSYSRAALGRRVAWAVGWCLILEYLVASSTIAVGWSGYAVSAAAQLGISLPDAVSKAPVMTSATGEFVHSGAYVNLPAALIVLLMTALLVIGVRESARANNVLVLIKVGVILLVIGAGMLYVEPDNWRPFVPAEGGDSGEFGWSGVLRAAGLIFYAYIGFETISTCAQESSRPERDLGIAMIVALAICTALYVGLALVMTGLAHYSQLNVPDPIIVALDRAGPALAWLKPLVSVGAVLGLASTVLVTLYGQTRIFYAMSQDGALPPAFSVLHERFRTPALGILIAGVLCAILAAVFPLDVLGELVSMGTLLAFTAVCVAVPVLRVRSPDLPRPIRIPFGPLIPILGALSCLYLMYSLPSGAWWRLAIWLAVGVLVYFAVHTRRSASENTASRPDLHAAQ